MKTKRYAFNTVITIPIDAVKTCMKGALIGKFKNLAINSTGIGKPQPPKYNIDTNNAERIKFM